MASLDCLKMNIVQNEVRGVCENIDSAKGKSSNKRY